MTTTEIDLSGWCAKQTSGGYYRYRCSEPFVQSGYRYFTDLKAAVRVPTGDQDTTAPEGEKLPAAFKLSYWRRFPLVHAVPLPAVELPPLVMCDECEGGVEYECPECEGSGEVEWDGRYSGNDYHAECRMCDGDGFITRTVVENNRRLRDELAAGWIKPADSSPCDKCHGSEVVEAKGEHVVCGVRVAYGYMRKLLAMPEVEVAAKDDICLLFQSGEIQGLVMGLQS